MVKNQTLFFLEKNIIESNIQIHIDEKIFL